MGTVGFYKCDCVFVFIFLVLHLRVHPISAKENYVDLESTICIPAFNRNGRLGFLYSGYDNRITHPSIFQRNIPEVCIWETWAYSTVYTSTVTSSHTDFLDSLDISMDMQLSILSGTAAVEASAIYAAIEETRTNVARGMISVTITTLERGFHEFCSNLTTLYVPYRILDPDFTHYVSAILYGYTFHLVFEGTASETFTKSEIEAKISADLNTLLNMLTAKVGYKSTSTNSTERLSFTVNFVGDMKPPTNVLTTMEGVSDFVKKSVKDLTASATKLKEFGKPLRYYLTPLSELLHIGVVSNMSAPCITRLSTVEEYSCLERMTDLESSMGLLQKAIQTSAQMESCESSVGKNLLVSQFRSFSAFSHEYKRNVSKNIELRKKGDLAKSSSVCPELTNSSFAVEDIAAFLSTYSLSYDVVNLVSHFKEQGITCLKSTTAASILSLDFLNSTTLILTFQKNDIRENPYPWNLLSAKFMKFCYANYGCVCKIVHCDQSTFICTHEYPVIKVFSHGEVSVYDSKSENKTLFDFMKPFITETRHKYIMARSCIQESKHIFHTITLPEYIKRMGSFTHYAKYEDISEAESYIKDLGSQCSRYYKRLSIPYTKEDQEY